MTQAHHDALFTQIGEVRLRRLLWHFYARVMTDPLLSPIFHATLGPYPHAGWPVHIARLEGFWRAVTHGPSAYRGQPGPAHQGLGLDRAHFDRWLHLWETTVTDDLPAPEAQALMALAQRMRPTIERFAQTPPGKDPTC
ncbi:group III truncated hemoglobin [Deinococcus radiotolerans]|uniref:Preprotein translocase subunit TatC n=1 Tax=Deinococcus radiotolerans TaxID=1309407 RepID=A0ABQ2FMM6_9DEIO|nr:group III truncated hemoglobin [Deinococcus radiotolerans]GGL07979.1 preprotein translocase subunit TatC [Deinococcus radiotolerans]